MKSTAILLSLLHTASVGLVTGQQTAGSGVQCPTGNGVGIIVARASTEQPGTGTIGIVAQDVVKAVPGSTVMAVDYPATLQNYQQSEGQGVAAMTKLVQGFQTQCQGKNIVLMGYSQGAQVAMDMLCGTSEQGFQTTPPLASNVAGNVAAVLLMGDPSHVPSQPFNTGTSKNAGTFPRQNVASCGPVADRINSICNTGDTFCDSGDSLQTHLSYVQSNGQQATQFVVARVQGFAGGATSNSTLPVSSGTKAARSFTRRWFVA